MIKKNGYPIQHNLNRAQKNCFNFVAKKINQGQSISEESWICSYESETKQQSIILVFKVSKIDLRI